MKDFDPTPVIGGVAIFAVMLAVIFTVDSCAKRGHDFRVQCVSSGGSLIESGSSMNCIAGNGSVAKR